MHHRFSAASAIVNNNVVLYFNMCCFSSLSGKAVFFMNSILFLVFSFYFFISLFISECKTWSENIYQVEREDRWIFARLAFWVFFSSELFFWVNCSLLCGKTRQCLLVFLFRNCHVCKDNYRVFVVIFCSPAQSQHCLTKHNLSFVHTKLVFTWLLIEF